MSYNFKAVENEVREFWNAHDIVAKAKHLAHSGPRGKCYFLDGPPYTSGHVHIGTAWNKSLKDAYIRFKRMSGWDIWDRAGYDMHGLPTERATEKALNIFGKIAIMKYGAEQFVAQCKKTCIDNARDMSATFSFMGVWMDFEKAYMTVDKEYIEGVWWFVHRAFEEGRLYEAEKTMTWDAVNSTALAKHELEYHNITDSAIYVKFAVKPAPTDPAEPKTYFVIWTTTPWTIPFNLAVMAGPDIDYVRIQVVHKGVLQVWVIAQARLEDFVVQELGITEYKVLWSGKGKDLCGMEYEHPFATINGVYAKLKASMPKIHTVLMSAEYVDTKTGTGLVHCAPGCGPEDYVVGQENGIAPFNTVDENGFFTNLEPMTGLRAKLDDPDFINLIDKQGALVHKGTVDHDYAFGERSKAPVIFRTTRQWFLRVEDLKQKLLDANSGVTWYPQAAKNAFTAWLSGLRDNSISKQRFWGTPLPIWRSVDDASDWVVVKSAEELCSLAGLPQGSLVDLHPPVVDKIEFTRVSPKDSKPHIYHRVPDILDVWVDAGAAFFNCLQMPGEPPRDHRANFLPAEFILEGRDQIRGWFNLLHLESMVAFGKPCFEHVYMHGFVNDSQGRKMSKTQGNYILPQEVWDKYGVDTLRYYLTGAANPGEDMSYNMLDVEQKFKNLGVFWNIHRYLLTTCTTLADVAFPVPLAKLDPATLGIEDRYILSRLNATIRDATQTYEQHNMHKVPVIVEDFLMELSHVYIQLIWEKKDNGSPAEKQALLSTLTYCVINAFVMLSTFAPFIAEKIYQNLRTSNLPGMADFTPAESIHHLPWPTCDARMIDTQLEVDVNVAKDAIAALLVAREKVTLPVKQPSREARLDCPTKLKASLQRTSDLISLRTNVKALILDPPEATITVSPNNKTIGKQFGRNRQQLCSYIEKNAAEIGASLCKRTPTTASASASASATWSLSVDLALPSGPIVLTEEHISVTHAVPKHWAVGKNGDLTAFVDTTRTDELEWEGRVRELAHKIQLLRKKGGMQRNDKARVRVLVPGNAPQLVAAITSNAVFLAERTGSLEVAVAAVDDPAATLAIEAPTARVSSIDKVASHPIALIILP
ncbi:Isoleucyl-tRNA synthetase [Pelomyxa schiedti]|nr:Isoleucyl-tRNA synthetase [Pelomyxa schiedti]